MQVPSIVKHTSRRFVSISFWAIGGGLIGYLLPRWFEFCQSQFGNALYGLVPVMLLPMLWFSYIFGKMDMANEERRNGRVLNELSKD